MQESISVLAKKAGRETTIKTDAARDDNAPATVVLDDDPNPIVVDTDLKKVPGCEFYIIETPSTVFVARQGITMINIHDAAIPDDHIFRKMPRPP